MSKIDISTFTGAIKKTKDFLNEGTEQSLLASILLSINTLELVLVNVIDLERKMSLFNVLSERRKKLNSVNNNVYGYDLEKVIERVSLRDKATLGEIIKHIEKNLIFPEKSELLKLLTTINNAREKVVHKLLYISDKNKNSTLYIKELAKIIVISSDRAMDLCFDMSERSSDYNMPQLTRK